MRRPVRGHSVMLESIHALGPKKPGGKVLFALQMVCLTCRTLWFEDMNTSTRDRVVHGPNRRRAVSDVVTAAVSKTPTCEDAYRTMVVRDVIES